MSEHRKRLLALLLGAVLPAAVAIAACGSSGGAPSAGTSSADAHTSTTTPLTAPTSTSTSTAAPATTTTPTTATSTATNPASTTSSTTATGSAPCVAADLALSFVGQQGGLGHGEIGFALRNTSGASCHTYGYPGVLFLGRVGKPLPTIPHRATQDYFGNGGPARRLLVAPGASVSFRLDVGHGVATSNGCATAYALQVIAPDDTATLRTPIPGGAYECRDANVSPLRAGRSAYP